MQSSTFNNSIVVDVRDVVKKYGDFTAVNGVSFKIHRGETFGLLGPNGAGKTSTMRIVSGTSPLNGGSVHVVGLDVSKAGRAARNMIGVVTQHDGIDIQLTVRKNLEMYGYLAGLSLRDSRNRASEVLSFFDLEERGSADTRALSGGMKRRLAIARSMMSSPLLLVMDEPTTGLDPQSRNRVWEQLGELKQAGVTILMSTHYMVEAETLCDRLAIMDNGQILDVGAPEEVVLRHVGSEVAILRISDTATREEKLALRQRLEEEGRDFSEVGSRIVVTAPKGERPDLESIKGIADMRITYRDAHLEDVFLVLTGRELRDE